MNSYYFYVNECINSNWSVRELARQINSLLYERITPSEDNYVLFLESALIYHQNSQTAMFRYLSILSLETVFFTLLDAKNQHSTQEYFCDAVQLTIWDMMENEHNDIPDTNTGNELPNNTEKEITENV